MKLIDLLVQELPKRGGWPKTEGDVTMIAGLFPSAWRMPSHVGIVNYIAYSLNDNEIVTREQYEESLAKSEKPEWSGEGLPPVGCKFEYGSHRTAATCLGVGLDMVFAWKGDPLQDTYEEFMISIKDSCFRPIRTEAERKRDEAIKFMSEVFRDHVDNKKSNGQDSVFHAIYDAFKAGKFE